MEKQYPQIWQFWAPKSAENLVPGRPGTKFSTPALVPGTAVHVLDSTFVQVARRTGKSVEDAVGFLSSLLELCETTVVRVCV